MEFDEKEFAKFLNPGAIDLGDKSLEAEYAALFGETHNTKKKRSNNSAGMDFGADIDISKIGEMDENSFEVNDDDLADDMALLGLDKMSDDEDVEDDIDPEAMLKAELEEEIADLKMKAAVCLKNKNKPQAVEYMKQKKMKEKELKELLIELGEEVPTPAQTKPVQPKPAPAQRQQVAPAPIKVAAPQKQVQKQQASSPTSPIAAEIMNLKRRALVLKKSGDVPGAIKLMNEAKAKEAEMAKGTSTPAMPTPATSPKKAAPQPKPQPVAAPIPVAPKPTPQPTAGGDDLNAMLASLGIDPVPGTTPVEQEDDEEEEDVEMSPRPAVTPVKEKECASFWSGGWMSMDDDQPFMMFISISGRRVNGVLVIAHDDMAFFTSEINNPASFPFKAINKVTGDEADAKLEGGVTEKKTKFAAFVCEGDEFRFEKCESFQQVATAMEQTIMRSKKTAIGLKTTNPKEATKHMQNFKGIEGILTSLRGRSTASLQKQMSSRTGLDSVQPTQTKTIAPEATQASSVAPVQRAQPQLTPAQQFALNKPIIANLNEQIKQAQQQAVTFKKQNDLKIAGLFMKQMKYLQSKVKQLSAGMPEYKIPRDVTAKALWSSLLTLIKEQHEECSVRVKKAKRSKDQNKFAAATKEQHGLATYISMINAGFPNPRQEPPMFKVAQLTRQEDLLEDDLGPEEIEIAILNGTKINGEKPFHCHIGFDLEYPSEDPIQGQTTSIKADENSPKFNFIQKYHCPGLRGRGFSRRKIMTLNVFKKGGFFSSDKCILEGRFDLAPLQCESNATQSVGFNEPGKSRRIKEKYGSVEVAIRIQKPLKNVATKVVKYNKVMLTGLPAIKNPPAAVAASRQPTAPAATAGQQQQGQKTAPTGAQQPKPKAGGPLIVNGIQLNMKLIKNIHDVNNIVSFGVLESMLEAAEAKATANPDDTDAMVQQSMIGSRMAMIEKMVESGDMSQEEYVEIIGNTIKHDTAVAVYFDSKGRKAEAVAMRERVCIMRSELEGGDEEDE
eukprot:TRINITY_DN5778_c2_g2_i2.p1 TRINITY_DN5778_c2_g2~~TRINITY_DN5778_c2_g2_i2.p1  ORF type:complete len:1009 (+),score=450.11 TRINITY_DN5778_c2_g2_i2:80-3106(+)